ncbi:FliH/SctL family protein [Litorisediminicola beolgyonensis]|uniref:Flagellar assembly protein H n=1 Tax=Litorisediminicola beolgyonensis TaxID=1173614 RepID=A0ABW3ZFN7_9RHOB
MGLLFDRDFDQELEMERGGFSVAGRSYSEDELTARLAAAADAARAEGHAAGRAELAAEQAARTLETQSLCRDAIAQGIAVLLADADAHRQALEADLVEFALAVMRRLAPEILATLSERRVRAELQAGLPLVTGPGRVRLTLAPDMLEALRPEIAEVARAQDLDARLEIDADPALRPGDARIEWQDGLMHYSLSAICDQLIDLLRGRARTAQTATQSPEARHG